MSQNFSSRGPSNRRLLTRPRWSFVPFSGSVSTSRDFGSRSDTANSTASRFWPISCANTHGNVKRAGSSGSEGHRITHRHPFPPNFARESRALSGIISYVSDVDEYPGRPFSPPKMKKKNNRPASFFTTVIFGTSG